MTGLFGSLNTATGGMRAQQAALQTTGHNLSNINTPGYSRQRVTMKTSFPQSMAGIGQMGTGVQISGITRVTDEYVTRQLENELSSFIEHGNISEVLGQLEAIYNEPSDSSVSHQMSEFFASWGSLANDPSSGAGKKLVVSQSETFTDTINHIANKIDSLAEDTIGQIKKDVLDFNSTAKQLHKINNQIFQAKVKGEQPNDLLDTQDQLIGQLKSIADVDIDTDQYGRVSVSFTDENGENVGDIVTNTEVKEIAVGKNGKIYYDVESDNIENGFVKDSNINSDGNYIQNQGDANPKKELEMTRGSIKGFQTAHENVREKEKQLDKFVNEFAKSVNTIMKQKVTKDGTKIEIDDNAIAFFTLRKDGEEFTAKNIRVNKALTEDPSKLVTGKEFKDGASGDGSRAKAIADLESISLNFSKGLTFKDGTLTLESHDSGSKLFNNYNEMITDMGIIKQQADNMMANQADLVSLLDQRKESISGVDTNEEVVNLIQQQSAFQANARVISTINEMLDTLINRTGV